LDEKWENHMMQINMTRCINRVSIFSVCGKTCCSTLLCQQVFNLNS